MRSTAGMFVVREAVSECGIVAGSGGDAASSVAVLSLSAGLVVGGMVVALTFSGGCMKWVNLHKCNAHRRSFAHTKRWWSGQVVRCSSSNPAIIARLGRRFTLTAVVWHLALRARLQRSCDVNWVGPWLLW